MLLMMINSSADRGTQRFVSGNICLEGLKSPEIFGIAVKARDFFSKTSRRIFVTRGRISSYCFWRDKGQLAFLESHQQLENSADRILFPKIFCGLNIQLKIRTDQSVLAYTNMPLKRSEAT